MTMNRNAQRRTRTYAAALIIALAPFAAIPLLGSHFYFRHDDASALLWAKEFVHPLRQVFSPDPSLNHFNDYPGMAGAWRPFSFIYIKALWHLFGTTPGPYFVVGGILFIAVVSILFAVTATRSGPGAAVLSCLLLFGAFHGTMYNLFHIGMPSAYFFQIIMIACFWSYLRTGRRIWLVGSILFLWPAMSRQTTPMLLAAILLARLSERRRDGAPSKGRLAAAAGIIAAELYLITLTPNAGYGSVVSVLPDVARTLDFVYERYLYYGGLLTTGITGLIMLVAFQGAVFHDLARRIAGRFNIEGARLLWAPAALAAAFVLMRLGPFAIHWLTLCFLYLLIADGELRLPLAWAGASLASYLAVQYYHNGYLLEAALPISIAAGTIAARGFDGLARAARSVGAPVGRSAAIIVAVAALALTLLLRSGVRIPFLSQRITTMRLSIDSNRNFRDLIEYAARELSPGATVYELGARELGTTSLEGRHLSLERRAAVTKIMDARDMEVMLRVLDRADIEVRSTDGLADPSPPGGSYFIALNAFEREIAQARFNLRMLREFRGELDSAALYVVD